MTPYELDNDFKIRFCNAAHALEKHRSSCASCFDYCARGDGDLCPVGQNIILEAFFPLGTKQPVDYDK